MFYWLDNALLNLAQNFCDKFHLLTGRTKFWLEKWSLIATLIIFLVFVVMTAVLFLEVCWVLLATISIVILRNIEKEERDFLARNEITFSPCHIPSYRLGFLLQGVANGTLVSLSDGVSWTASTFVCGITISTMYIYLSACFPQRPGKSKARELAENVLRWINNILPNPRPILG